MTHPNTGDRLRRTTGALFLVGALAFAAAATVLSATFNWPDVLREPADVVLPAYVAGGTSLVWTWLATAWTYAILAVPILLLPTVLGRRDDPALRVATAVGATSVLLSLIGFLRWVFVVPPLAHSYVTGDPVTQAAVNAAWTAQHQYGGALLGEHLGQLLAIAWSISLSVIILRSGVLPRWLGVTGLVVSALYLSNQGDILATAVPGFPVWDLGGLIGSTTWGLWVAALGVDPAAAPHPHIRSATGAERRHPRRGHAGHHWPPPATGAEHRDRLRGSSNILPAHLVALDRRVPGLPAGRFGRHRGGRPRRQPPRCAARRHGHRAGDRRRPGVGEPPQARPALVDSGHRDRHGPRTPAGRSPCRLPHLARRPRPDGRPHRARPGYRASRRAAPRDPAPVGLGGRDARPVGAGMDRHHPRRDRGRPAVHGLRRLRSGDVLRAVRAAAAPAPALPTPPPTRTRRDPPVQATA